MLLVNVVLTAVLPLLIMGILFVWLRETERIHTWVPAIICFGLCGMLWLVLFTYMIWVF